MVLFLLCVPIGEAYSHTRPADARDTNVYSVPTPYYLLIALLLSVGSFSYSLDPNFRHDNNPLL